MSRVRRIYAEKRPGYDVAARQLCQELREALGTEAISHVRIFQRYDVEGLRSDSLYLLPGIRVSQVLSGCLIILGIVILFIIRKRQAVRQ